MVWPGGVMDIRQMDRAAQLRAERDAHFAERQRRLEDEERLTEQHEDAKPRAENKQRLHRPSKHSV